MADPMRIRAQAAGDKTTVRVLMSHEMETGLRKDAAGKAIDSQVLTRGRITGVEMYDGVPYLTVGNSILPLSAVIALQEPRTPAGPPAANDDAENAMAAIASALNPMKLFS